jgi:hypothetical protein
MRTAITIRKIPAILYLLFVLASCKVMLVPQYSAQLEDQISNGAKATDRLYINMLDTIQGGRVYDNFKDQYNEIEVEINSIQLKNEGRPKNGDFLAIIKNLKDAFAEAKKYHKDHNTLSDGEAISYEATLSGYWKPLYLAEKGLK